MRICIDLTSLADNLSGIERYAACISFEMIKAHDDEYVLIFKNEIHPLFKDVCKKTNVDAIILPECKKLIFNQIRLPNALRKIQADCLYRLADCPGDYHRAFMDSSRAPRHPAGP